MTTTPPPGRAGVTQPALFEIHRDGNAGYRAPVVCKLAHITYRQLDYWGRTGLVTEMQSIPPHG